MSEVAEQAGVLRDQIAELITCLGEFDTEGENLQITRETLLGLPAPAPAPAPAPVDGPPRAKVPEHPAYQQILTVLTTPAVRCGPATSARPSTYRSCRRTPRASGPG
ncbi:hypothetical protein PUR28_17655 [Streptomyces sp. BE308]|uniref:hypothetical protein n=1 Tax=Streptomyces sp. BE308 TaxID=3002529 RepID=UPI002E76A5E3|nr:hypothetical protein [Streptomyces sp. BE308]MEE1792572.1 hypothetical protein [Streptomyces sp. BE308]